MDKESATLCESYACFQITVENRDYHHLSQTEIAGGKRISRHLSRFLVGIDRGRGPLARIKKGGFSGPPLSVFRPLKEGKEGWY
jgi:hypothetical protein